jgi:hypothetical protein
MHTTNIDPQCPKARNVQRTNNANKYKRQGVNIINENSDDSENDIEPEEEENDDLYDVDADENSEEGALVSPPPDDSGEEEQNHIRMFVVR